MLARTNSNVASIKWILKGRLNNALRYMTCHHVSADYTLIGTFMSYKELQLILAYLWPKFWVLIISSLNCGDLNNTSREISATLP